MIKVLIKRVVAPGMESTYDEFIRDIMSEGVKVPGYISGEMLHDVEHPNIHYVIVTIHTLHDWQGWFKSPARTEALERIRPLLLEPEEITILSH